MAKSEDLIEAMRRSIEELRIPETQNTSAASGHSHVWPKNGVEERAHINIAELRSLREAELAAAAGHNHRVARNDAEEELMLNRAMQESCPATKEAYKLINGLKGLAYNYFRNEKVLSFVDEACIYLSSEEKWTSNDFKNLIYDLHHNYECYLNTEVSGFVSFIFDNLN